MPDRRDDLDLSDQFDGDAPRERPGRYRDGGLELVDNTADADPGTADYGTGELDGGETGDQMEGMLGEDDASMMGDDRAHHEPRPAEEAAMHIIDEP